MSFLGKYLRQRRKEIIVFIVFAMFFICSFAMYHIVLDAVLYPVLLCCLVGVCFLIIDYLEYRKKHKFMQNICHWSGDMVHMLPNPKDSLEEDYQRIIVLLWEQQKHLEEKMNGRYQDMMDYYTIWVHQIKTPISSMRLHLQNEETSFSKKVLEDLFRIEQYVEMVLTYLRLDSDSTDYLFKEYDLDDIVRTGIKKFSSQFIRRKIGLNYNPLNYKVLTDEKWLSFVFEQILSNALKYTEKGSITIEMMDTHILCIRDTGIGIEEEDLPRIFEKGYTGYHGRTQKKASGLGLYLCKRICDNLGLPIFAESILGEGTAIYIDLRKRKLEVE